MSDNAVQREEKVLQAFTERGSGPKPIFALVLVSVAIASWSLSMDEVERYSKAGFCIGVGLALFLSIVVGFVIESLTDPTHKKFASIVLPTFAGGAIGVVIQSIVLAEVGTGWVYAVKDLGGLIDTTRPVEWIAAGTFLGGVPALIVTGFVLLAARTLKKLAGHDAPESFGVAFVGIAGLISSGALFAVKGLAIAPLVLVACASIITVMIARLIDGSRVAFLNKVYAQQGEEYDVVPVDQFASDRALAPMVAGAKTGAVLVKVSKGEYRASAMEPIALVGETREDTLRPLHRRRGAATLLLVATIAMTTGGLAFHFA